MLKKNMRNKIYFIFQDDLQHVNVNFLRLIEESSAGQRTFPACAAIRAGFICSVFKPLFCRFCRMEGASDTFVSEFNQCGVAGKKGLLYMSVSVRCAI
jgi:hypothetical protein